jgi:hypothetical protein
MPIFFNFKQVILTMAMLPYFKHFVAPEAFIIVALLNQSEMTPRL